jgi:predicted phosphodiesterase
LRDAVLFDIHGNIDALAAVLSDAADAGCDGLLLGGDYAYMGPAPDDCVDLLREHPGRVVAIRGNTDRMIANGDDHIAEWAADRLGDERVSWLGGLQTARVLPEHDAVIVHAVPGDDEWRLTPDTPDELAEARTADVGHATMLCGHVHLQYSRKVGEVEVVNPGSVGFPFDGDQRAAWAIIDDGQVELRRTAYDVERALARLAGLASHPERALAERRLQTARS